MIQICIKIESNQNVKFYLTVDCIHFYSVNDTRKQILLFIYEYIFEMQIACLFEIHPTDQKVINTSFIYALTAPTIWPTDRVSVHQKQYKGTCNEWFSCSYAVYNIQAFVNIKCSSTIWAYTPLWLYYSMIQCCVQY